MPWRQGPGGPVGALESLVEADAEVFLEKRGEPDAGLVEELRRDPGVEDVGGAETVLAIEQAEVVIGVVKDDLDGGVGKEIAANSARPTARGSTTAVSLREEVCRR